MKPVSIVPTKHLVGPIDGDSGYTVVVYNCWRNVYLWRPLNYTLPSVRSRVADLIWTVTQARIARRFNVNRNGILQSPIKLTQLNMIMHR